MEVGCGPGIAATSFATSMMKDGGVICVSDISDKMIDLFGKRISNPKNGYVSYEKNKLHF